MVSVLTIYVLCVQYKTPIQAELHVRSSACTVSTHNFFSEHTFILENQTHLDSIAAAISGNTQVSLVFTGKDQTRSIEVVR